MNYSYVKLGDGEILCPNYSIAVVLATLEPGFNVWRVFDLSLRLSSSPKLPVKQQQLLFLNELQ